jgi:cytochrome c
MASTATAMIMCAATSSSTRGRMTSRSRPRKVVEVAFADVYAAADPARANGCGASVQACHALEPGQNGVGPYLHGVVDRPEAFGGRLRLFRRAAVAGRGDWTPENISAFIENPRAYAPGTAMAYNGMRDVEDRANLIAYLATQ